MPTTFGAVDDQLFRNQQVAGSSPANGSKQHTPPPTPRGGCWPQHHRRGARLQEMESTTVGALVARYIAEETPLKARGTQRHDHYYARLIVEAWGDLEVADVTTNLRTLRPYTDLRRQLGHICERAGVRVTPHWLRHTYGTAAAEAGCSTEEIAAVLGHRSSATASRYVHLAGTFARGAAQRAGLRVSGRTA